MHSRLQRTPVCNTLWDIPMASHGDRAGRTDSAIAVAEDYLRLAQAGRIIIGVDARFRAGVLKRRGELYDAKGATDKALTRYQSFLDLWKNADPELQTRAEHD